MKRLEVSIEQDDCTACGLCPEFAPEHFFMGDDNFAYVNGEDEVPNEAEPQHKGFLGKVAVRSGSEEAVIDAAEDCPGACIYVEEAEGQAAA